MITDDLKKKKFKAYLNDFKEGDKVHGSDEHNLQHAGDGVPPLLWDNMSSAHPQWGYCNLIEIVFTCDFAVFPPAAVKILSWITSLSGLLLLHEATRAWSP